MIKEFQIYVNITRGSSYNNQISLIMHDMDKLFDIFCENSCQRRRVEVLHHLYMNKRDFAFYSDLEEKRKSRAIVLLKN